MNSSPLQKKRDTTKQHSLDAARNIFAQRGFAGARMDEIARLARVNKATMRAGVFENMDSRLSQDVAVEIEDLILDAVRGRPYEQFQK